MTATCGRPALSPLGTFPSLGHSAAQRQPGPQRRQGGALLERSHHPCPKEPTLELSAMDKDIGYELCGGKVFMGTKLPKSPLGFPESPVPITFQKEVSF